MYFSLCDFLLSVSFKELVHFTEVIQFGGIKLFLAFSILLISMGS